MADDVTLRTCPFCGAPAEVYAPYKIIRCSNPDCLMEVRTMVNLREERRAEVWNTRVSDPRIAALEAELAALKARRCKTCKHVYHSELIPTRWVCVRLNENFEVLPDSDFCSRWQEKETADG